MHEIAYTIDKERSIKEKGLVIRLEEVKRNGYNFELKGKGLPLTKSSLQKMATSKDQDALAFLFESGKIFSNAFCFSSSQSLKALKMLAATGKVFFNQKQLVCDFFGKVEFYFKIYSPNEIRGYLKTTQQDFDLRECDFIGMGDPHWFIKGISLKVIATSVSWKDLTILYTDQTPQNWLEEVLAYQTETDSDSLAPAIVYANEMAFQIQSNPLPILKLKDRFGAFADLWMDYGSEKQICFHEKISSFFKRNPESEKSWERDLLETDFIPKTVENSHYYCPLDKVSKALTFLLEVGWMVIDYLGNRVIHQSDIEVSAKSMQELIHIEGKVKYENHQADLSDVVGCFNRRERFIQIAPGCVGLIPQTWNNTGLDGVIDEIELVNHRLQINKNKIGVLFPMMESSQLSLDISLKEMKERIQCFQSIKVALPGPSFQGQLRPYQQEGVNWLSFLYDYGFHGLLADDMGLGKTVQVLAFLSRIEWREPLLIVVPTSLIFNWKKEIERFLTHAKVILHHGPDRCKDSQALKEPTIILTSYSMLRLDLAIFSNQGFQCVILDEAQTIKNSSSQISKAVRSLKSRFRLSITGTPIENHLNELWSHFHFLIPELFHDEKGFLADVQASFSDSRFVQKIKKQIRPFILRRKKEEVAPDLPEKIEQVVWIEMEPEQKCLYEDFLAKFKGNLLKKVEIDGFQKHRMEIFEAILRLRQLCCHPLLVSSFLDDSLPVHSCNKLDALMQDLETAIEEKRKVLIYSQFTSMLSLISKNLTKRGWKFVYLDGSTKNREQVVQQFQEDPSIAFFLISLKAGGVGLNLTAADYVLIYDPWWNEAAENQAINRAHRIGRQETVIAKRYVTVDSIEEKMMKLKSLKQSLTHDILDNETAHSHLTEEDFRFLLS